MLKNKNPPETGIAMDNMKPSGSCPEKIEVVVVVVVVVVVAQKGPVIYMYNKKVCLSYSARGYPKKEQTTEPGAILNFVGPSFCKVLWPGAKFF